MEKSKGINSNGELQSPKSREKQSRCRLDRPDLKIPEFPGSYVCTLLSVPRIIYTPLGVLGPLENHVNRA